MRRRNHCCRISRRRSGGWRRRRLESPMLPEPYYADEAVTLYHGDCLQILPLLGPVDHVITDPPYEAEAHTKGRRAGSTYGAVDRPLDFDPISNNDRLISGSLLGIARGWILVFCQVEAAMLWRYDIPAAYVRMQIWRQTYGETYVC